MSNTEEKTAPKPGRGFTVVELRTPHQAEIVKAHVKGTKAGAVTVEDRWVVVKNTDAQLVVDKAIAGSDTMTEFEGRVISYFLAVIILGNEKVTDSRTTLQARLLDVGRTTKGFRVGMKSDNKLEVSVGSKTYGTVKEAMMAIAPDRVKAPTSESPSTADDKAAKAKQGLDDIETYKSQKAALKAWEETPESERGPRPNTDIFDRMTAEHAAKEAKASAEAAARKTEREEAAAKKRDVTPRPKAESRKAS